MSYNFYIIPFKTYSSLIQYILTAASLPPLLPAPPLPYTYLLPGIRSSFISLQKRTSLLRIPTEQGIKRYHKTRHKPSRLDKATQKIKGPQSMKKSQRQTPTPTVRTPTYITITFVQRTQLDPYRIPGCHFSLCESL